MLEVILSENDSKLVQFVILEKEISDRSGVQTQLKVYEQKNNAVGVIVKTEDDKIFVDNTIEAILGRREKELRLKIARFLFNKYGLKLGKEEYSISNFCSEFGKNKLVDIDFNIMSDIVYQERVSSGLLIKGLMTIFSGIIVFGTLFMTLLVGLSVEDYYGLVFSWGILTFVLLLFWNYRYLEIRINPDNLLVRYGIFNKKSIMLTDIISCPNNPSIVW